ncbi:MAG: adenosylcobinamide-GDP ribazoletransferase [Chitinophagales bacterium]
MKTLLLAFQFLTRIPLPATGQLEPKDLGRCSAWFPLVGGFLGLLLVLVNFLVGRYLDHQVTAVLLVIILTALTGGLHLDGLMDSVDGLMGGRNQAQALDIMRDSRVGALGAIAGCLVILLKWAALFSLLSQAHSPWFYDLILFPIAGRWAMTGMACFMRPARHDGLGSAFADGADVPQFLVATLIAVGLVWFAGSWRGLYSLAAAGFAAILFSLWIKRRLGGMTGDTCGAINEFGEATALLLLLIIK